MVEGLEGLLRRQMSLWRLEKNLVLTDVDRRASMNPTNCLRKLLREDEVGVGHGLDTSHVVT